MMREKYEKPTAEELLFLPGDPIALSENGDEDDFQGGVPFSLRDNFQTFEE